MSIEVMLMNIHGKCMARVKERKKKTQAVNLQIISLKTFIPQGC